MQKFPGKEQATEGATIQNNHEQEISLKLEPEEETKRKEIRVDFDKAVNEFRQKMSSETTEEQLKKRNDELKAEMQKVIDDNKKKSEEIEQRIQEKQKSTDNVQEKLKTMMQSKLEQLLTDSTNEKKHQIELLQKEQEIKAQIQMYSNNFDQLDDSLKKSTKVFSQLKKELKKVPHLSINNFQKAEMLKTVETQKAELMKIKEGFDVSIIELTDHLKEFNAEKDAARDECQALQKELMKPL